ncbi:unnamed protein product, partial [marine sediment metagenome]
LPRSELPIQSANIIPEHIPLVVDEMDVKRLLSQSTTPEFAYQSER